MAKKSTKNPTGTFPQVILFLVVVECALSLFVIIKQQSQIEHEALLTKIQTMKTAHPQVYCPQQPDQKMTIDNQEKLPYAK